MTSLLVGGTRLAPFQGAGTDQSDVQGQALTHDEVAGGKRFTLNAYVREDEMLKIITFECSINSQKWMREQTTAKKQSRMSQPLLLSRNKQVSTDKKSSGKALGHS